jgi:hypothetical protein
LIVGAGQLTEAARPAARASVSVDELRKKFWAELLPYLKSYLDDAIDSGEDLSNDEVKNLVNIFTNNFLRANFKRGANNAFLGNDNVRIVSFAEALINEAKRDGDPDAITFDAIKRIIAFIGEGTGYVRAVQQGSATRLQEKLNVARAELLKARAERDVLLEAGYEGGEDEEYVIEEEVEEGGTGEEGLNLTGDFSPEEIAEFQNLIWQRN